MQRCALVALALFVSAPAVAFDATSVDVPDVSTWSWELTLERHLDDWVEPVLAEPYLPSEDHAVELAGRIRYTVAPGDTLFDIAAEYGVSVSEIRRWNNLSGDGLQINQQLIIYTRGSSAERVRETYTVRSGDTGMAIARRHGVTTRELDRWNPGVDIDRLRIGQELTLYVDGGSEGSRGRPDRGRLRGGVPLEDGAGYRVRTPSRAYGTQETVSALRNGISRVVARYIDASDLVVHDLSYEGGGPMSPHRSHQNGLDADVSYYQLGADEVSEYVEITPEQLDVRLQWYLFRTWIDQGLVEYIFVDWELQEPLYEYAASRGATPEQLEEWFQYPERDRDGIIRDEPGHDDHFHVRFTQQ